VAFDRITHSLQNIAVLNDVVEVFVTGDNAGGPPIISPQTIPVRNLLPLINHLIMSVDIMPIYIRQPICGFVKLV
jgi:hypothetical protein